MLRIGPLTTSPVAHAAARYLAYGVAVLIMSAATGWAMLKVGGTVLSLTDSAIIDGSGKADPVAGHEAALDNAVAPMPDPVAANASAPVEARAVVAPTRVSSDQPENDPAADFHSGSSGTYKTYCVRLCDGYYWPISFSTTSERLDRDAELCQSACRAPARLFVHRMPGGGPGTMVSLDGLPYTALKTAFQFRTKYDAQCKCQAQPWEDAARDQHRLFAAAESARKGNGAAAAEVKRLAAKLQAERIDAENAKKLADAQASKQLAELAKSNPEETRPPRRSGDQFASRIGTAPTVMRLGLPPEPPGHGRFIPASGSGRAWTDKVFSGN